MLIKDDKKKHAQAFNQSLSISAITLPCILAKLCVANYVVENKAWYNAMNQKRMRSVGTWDNYIHLVY